ncbi:acyl--CoA ligase [Nocardia cyriacigeorgica]|uniref:Acyl--CoA ligase n=1 Tax=Nocardia cyriacigeorgica TaxID=135487 RepID=A0A6P1CU06_9NOCA|nr:class I adenylate-forming enzyme family protein [Nocardia cyriacigeorgica]NEW36040.1 acyl--CoA ligase [Nocardia cyriacigeorgica]
MPLGNPLTVCAAFERVARIFPNAQAVVDSASQLTFAQLDAASRRCVALLRAQGVQPGTNVGLLTVPSTVHLLAWLSVVRLGAIPVVLHTREAPELLAGLCNKFNLTTLLHDMSLTAAAAEITPRTAHPVRTVALRSAVASEGRAGPTAPQLEIPRDLATFAPARDLPAPGEDEIAAIILSSGTTSLPKGVMHTHRALIDAARAGLSLYGALRPGHRVIIPYSTAFTAAYATFLPFLNAGACSVFLEKFDLLRYQQTVERQRITHMSLTPTMWRKLLTLPATPDTYRNVRVAQFAAEPMDSTTLQLIRDTVTPNIVQAYGSTETLAFLTVNHAEDMVGDRLTSVGRPFLNVEVRVVRQGGTVDDIVPVGEIGEVVATSPSVGAGIWGDQELTEKIFPIDSRGCRWWRSSDLARIDDDGFVFLEGRSDDMIISGGINIMPAAVEEILLRHPGVLEAAVVGVPHPEWGQQVHAFVVAQDPALTETELAAFVVDSSLSGYQRPRQFHFVSSLPRTATNKLNRRALRDSAGHGPGPVR